MNPQEYETFIQRLYNAGEKDTDAIKEMHSFVQQPGTLQIILDSISSQQLSRITTLISLSSIPHVLISNSDGELLRSWFIDYIFNEAESLISDDFIALLVNLFLFIYSEDQKEGSLLLQQLSGGDQFQQILSIQIALRIIEKSEEVTNSDYLISIAISPFTDPESIPQLIDSASLLLTQLLLPRKSGKEQKEIQYIILREGIEANFPQNIFSNLFKFQEEPDFISLHLLELFNTILSIDTFLGLKRDMRLNYLSSSVRLFFDYFKKVKISEIKIPIISTIFVTLKNCYSFLTHEDLLFTKSIEFQTPKKYKPKEVPVFILDELILNASEFTHFILENNEYLRYLENVFDFWIYKKNSYLGVVNSKTVQNELEKILDIIMGKFFTIDILNIEGEIIDIMNDRSSEFVQKMVDFASNKIELVCERVVKFLIEEIDVSKIDIISFVIEFIACASDKVESVNIFELILNDLFDFQQKFEPQNFVNFEIALIHFYNVFLKRFNFDSDDFDLHANQLRDFFFRFLVDIQAENASIEVIQEFIDLLQSKSLDDRLLEIIAQDGEAFDLITSSQIITSPELDQPKKVTKTVFQVAFQFGFLMPEPDNVVTFIDMITERIENDPNDSIAYLMMCGGFLSKDCKFDTFYLTLTNKFFPLLLRRIEEVHSKMTQFKEGENEGENANNPNICNNPKITIDILHLFNAISECFKEKPTDYLSNVVVDFSELTLKILNLCLDISEGLEKDSVEFYKVISLVSLILSNLLLNNDLDFGVLEFYKADSCQLTLIRLLECFLTIPFDAFEQNPKLLNRYFTFIKNLIGEYLTFFISIDDIILQHHFHILIFIFELGLPQISLEAVITLSKFASSLYPFEIPIVEEKIDNVSKYLIHSAFNFILRMRLDDSNSADAVVKLVYNYLLFFPKLRNYLFDEIAQKMESIETVDTLHTIFYRIKSSFLEPKDDDSLKLFKLSIKSLIKYSRSNGVDFSFPSSSDALLEANGHEE